MNKPMKDPMATPKYLAVLSLKIWRSAFELPDGAAAIVFTCQGAFQKEEA
jgi:hypothetical protein